MNIAIIDDSSFSRRQLRRVLLEAFPQAVFIEFSSGNEAIEKLPQAKVNLITLDLVMPPPGGMEVLEQLRSKGVTTPIFIVSADIQESTQKRCFELGCSGFLEKPLTASKLHVLKDALA